MENGIKLNKTNPRLTANILSKITFLWMFKLCYKGVKRGIRVSDLYQVTTQDRSDRLCDALERNWELEMQRSKVTNSKPSLLRAICRTYRKRYLVYSFVAFVLFVLMRPIVPIVLSMFIKLFSNSDATKDEKYDMYLYGSLISVIPFFLIFFTHNLTFATGQIGMRVRIACCSLIYRKMLRLSQKSVGQSAAGQVVNILSNDVSRFDLMAVLLYHLFLTPFVTILLTYIIWTEVGVSAIVGVSTLVVLTVPVHAYVGKMSSVFRRRIADRTDKRVRLMTEIVSGIQVIKMYAWEKPFEKMVELTRRKEINVISLASYIRGITTSSAVFVERTILYVTVICYVFLGNVITAEKVFSMAQLFNMLQLYLAILFPYGVSIGSETLVTISRLEAFLMLEERKESTIRLTSDKSIVLKDVNASWVQGVKTLKRFNLEIPPGKLCAVIGPVGAGKSSVLQLLLGELAAEGGIINVGGAISYSSQEPWLFTSTVRKNILFGLDYDKSKYNEIIRVCGLEKDFKQLPQGDKSMVGERGTSLSGGQKARVNLARAVYREADIYLLDDPLSAVDTHVGKHLFEECITGYLRAKTRILVTHQLQYLKKADIIVVIRGGKIEVQGSFETVSNSKVDFTKMLLTSSGEVDKSEAPKTVIPRVVRSDSISSTLSVASIETMSQNGADTEEKLNRQGSSAYLEYIKAGGNVCVLFGLLVLIICGQVASNCSDLWVTYWTSQEAIRHANDTNCLESRSSNLDIVSLSQPNSTNYQSIYYTHDDPEYYKNLALDGCTDRTDIISTYNAIYIYTAIIAATITLTTMRSLAFYKVAMTASRNLHNKMFHCLLQVPMRFFDTNPSGRILNRFSRDMGAIDELLPRVMLDSIQVFLVMTGIFMMVCIANYYMIIGVVIVLILFYVIRGWYIATARDLKHLEGITRSPVFTHVSATLNGLTTIRATRSEAVLTREFDGHQDTHTGSWFLILACISTFGLWVDMLCIIFIACLTASFILMFENQTVDGSFVGLAISQSLILTGMLQHGMRQIADVVSQMTCVERVVEYTTLPKEVIQTAADQSPPQNWPHEGTIRFSTVNLKYSETDQPVLKNLTFVVQGGEKIGIVGRTGAGKSSLIAALFRLAPLEGSISIDDVDTGEVALKDLRAKISIIPQEPVLFQATIRYNLDPFGEYSDAEIWNALEEVDLKESISSLEFEVRESGGNFSVGQRQLVCLARAILRNNKILVLDEATANIDPKTDAFIQSTIRRKFQSCTVLTIAHRLNTVMDSDKILVMDSGSLVEYDHPYTLLNTSEGYLYKMVEQTGPSMADHLHSIARTAYGEKFGERL